MVASDTFTILYDYKQIEHIVLRLDDELYSSLCQFSVNLDWTVARGKNQTHSNGSGIISPIETESNMSERNDKRHDEAS